MKTETKFKVEWYGGNEVLPAPDGFEDGKLFDTDAEAYGYAMVHLFKATPRPMWGNRVQAAAEDAMIGDKPLLTVSSVKPIGYRWEAVWFGGDDRISTPEIFSEKKPTGRGNYEMASFDDYDDMLKTISTVMDEVAPGKWEWDERDLKYKHITLQICGRGWSESLYGRVTRHSVYE